MRRGTVALVLLVLAAGSASAVTPGKDLFIPSVGRLKGACTKGVCAQFRTDVWVLNPTGHGVNVTVAFLKRDTENIAPAATQSFALDPAQTLELTDVFDTVFHLDSVAGALRVTADREVVVTARVYDANVQTNIGTGTAGQAYEGLPAELAIEPGESTTVIGLAEQGGTWRSNLSVVETTGHPVAITLERIDASGQVLANHNGLTLGAFEAKQINRVLQFLGGSGSMANQRVRVSLPVGSEGRVLVAASRVDSRTGDPFTIAMTGEPIAAATDRTIGLFAGYALSQQGTVEGAISIEIVPGGLTSYKGMAAVACGGETYVLDFDVSYTNPLLLSAAGEFWANGAMSYADGQGGAFTAMWTLTGTVGADGAIGGPPRLRSDIAGAAGDFAACNGIIDRLWVGGWAGSLVP